MKRRTSPIWKIPAEEFQELLDTSESFVDLLIKVGLDPYNGNHKTLNQRIKEEGFDTSILEVNRVKKRKEHMKAIKKGKTYSLDMVLVENSNYSRNNLKRRLLDEGILKNECANCGDQGEWFDEKLTLQLDHINGINNDNRKENLRLLCPNCHSQTETYAGKRLKAGRSCVDCGAKVHKNSTRCLTCSKAYNGVKQRKFEISKEELKSLIAKYPMTRVGKILGVSDTAVRKRCVKFGIL